MKSEITEKEAKSIIEARNTLPLKKGISMIWHRSFSSRLLSILLILCFITFTISTGIFLVEIDDPSPAVYVLPDNQVIIALSGPENIHYSDGENTGIMISKIKEDILSIVQRKLDDSSLIISLLMMICSFILVLAFIKSLALINHIPEIPPSNIRVEADLLTWQASGLLPLNFEERFSEYLKRK